MSVPSSISSSPSQKSGRIIGRFRATCVVAWGQPELGGKCSSTSNSIIYIWKGIAPTFNLFLVIYNANTEASGPDMIVIDLQDNVLNRSFGTNALVGYNDDLSSGVCLLFSNLVSAERFETWMRVALLEAAAQRGDIPFRAFVAFLLNSA